MTATDTPLLLEATAVSKAYGAVVALRDASLAVRAGEIHALMGANGAGKSTLVKILTGAVRPDAGSIQVAGHSRTYHSPAQARQRGIVSVYQEPALIPDLDIRSNLRLTETPIEPFRSSLNELGLPRLDLSRQARQLPLATLRIIDLARALAIEPTILLLDEMTAALPANLTERVLETIGRQRGGDRSIIFISHRMSEIRTVCDRATVLREGRTVGVVDVSEGSEDRIVELMLGEIADETPTAEGDRGRTRAPWPASRRDSPSAGSARGPASRTSRSSSEPARCSASWRSRGRARTSSSTSWPGRSGPAAARSRSTASRCRSAIPPTRSAPGSSTSPADRAEALLMQRSVRENIALPRSARISAWGPINVRRERTAVGEAIQRLQIDTRAQREVPRLSGGNQQKVTIARWVTSGVHVMLCFDPTRGIDIRTKNQIYQLLRDLADAGAGVLLYTSELNEIRLACDRAIVLFGGRIVAEVDAAGADEQSLLRAAHNLARPAAPATGVAT